MDFVELKSKDEEYHILSSQIGYWSVAPHTCDKCGSEHYVLEIYDRNNNFLCSLEGSKLEIEALSGQISKDLKSRAFCRSYSRFCKGGIVVCRRKIH